MRADSVVFDVGNVLIQWDARRLFRKLVADPAQIEPILQRIGFSEWNLEQDRGRSYAEGVALLSARHPEHAHLIRAYDERWQETVPGVVDGSIEILERLRGQNVPLYAITNFSREKWADSLQRFPFLAQFRDVVVSAHERLVKPDAAIYQLFLSRNGLQAGQCVFVDDSLPNILAAQAVGMRGVHFTGAEALAGELRELGFAV